MHYVDYTVLPVRSVQIIELEFQNPTKMLPLFLTTVTDVEQRNSFSGCPIGRKHIILEIAINNNRLLKFFAVCLYATTACSLANKLDHRTRHSKLQISAKNGKTSLRF